MQAGISGIVSPAQIYSQNVAAQNGLQEKDQSSAVNFGDIFSGLVRQADEQYNVASQGTQALLAGETDNLAQVMIDSAKAETSLNMVIQIRNKVLDAYNEVMRMAL